VSLRRLDETASSLPDGKLQPDIITSRKLQGFRDKINQLQGACFQH
jgi:hypothetical protein